MWQNDESWLTTEKFIAVKALIYDRPSSLNQL